MILAKNGLSFKLNPNDFSAEIVKSESSISNIFVPEFVTYDSIQYNVTQISPKSFLLNKKIKSLQFSENSKVNTIRNEAFSGSTIKNILFPKSLKKICKDAFSYCRMLKTVEFPDDSELETIEEASFYSSSIESISIPRRVKTITRYSFSHCSRLTSIQFYPDSELACIEKEAFILSPISDIFIPPKVEDINDGWCSEMNELVNITISPNNKDYIYLDNKMIIGKTNRESSIFDKIIFARRNIEKVEIPSVIKSIGDYSFSGCKNLESIEFTEDSMLESIGEKAFSFTTIKNIRIPRHVKIIKKFAFSSCKNLETINFSEDSELALIERDVFSSSSIRSIAIPPNVEEIEGGCFQSAFNLKEISISPQNKNFCILNDILIVRKSDKNNDVFDEIIFARCDIEKVEIPAVIKSIYSFSFAQCQSLKSVEFSEDSQLVSIGENAFFLTSIVSISIPPHVCEINATAFNLNRELKSFEFLGEEFKSHLFFLGSNKLCLFSFPNVNTITFFIPEFLNDFTLFVRSGADFRFEN